MTESMVEKIALAICVADGGHWREPPFNNLHTDSLNNRWRFIARAAIEAMREPDDEMAKAGIAAWEKSPMAVVTQFRAMIDKAIQESGE